MPRGFYRQLLNELSMKQPSDRQENPPVEGTVKSRQQVMADREAKKLAKHMAKIGQKEAISTGNVDGKSLPTLETYGSTSYQKSREEILVERAAKKLEKKQGGKSKQQKANSLLHPEKPGEPQVTNSTLGKAENPEKSKAQLRAERRAKQEEERAKKAEASATKEIKVQVEKKVTEKIIASEENKDLLSTLKKPSVRDNTHRVKLFAHLYAKCNLNSSVLRGVEEVHPYIARLGAQYRTRTICGSNVRCLALLAALKQVILDYRTSHSEEFTRELGAELTRSMAFLQSCRPVSVSMSNAVKHLRAQMTRKEDIDIDSDIKEDIKEKLVEWIDTYVKDQLEKASEAISISVLQKISDGDVILTYGCSSLIQKILISAANEGIRFRVIVVDGRPWLEGRELIRRLLQAHIPCTYILVNALSFVIPEVTKILLGAHALLANGYVMARCGSSQVALLGRAANVPVLVCCETHKFSERVQTDSFVHNELADPDELLTGADPAKWRNIPALTPLNLVYDVTPPDLVSAVVTELAILPCTSVPVILRIK